MERWRRSRQGLSPLLTPRTIQCAATPCKNYGPTFTFSRMCEMLRQLNLIDLDLCPLTSLMEDSHAPTLVAPGKARDYTVSKAACGLRCGGSLEKFDHALCLWKMYLLCDCEVLTGYSLIWRNSVTPAGRPWLVLGRSEPRTNGIGSGSWVTPTETERESATSAEPYLTTTGTVRAMRPDGKSSNMGLTAQAAWTTPQAHDYQGQPDAKRVGRFGTKHGGKNLLDDIAVLWPTVHGNQGNNGPSGTELGNAVTQNWPTPDSALGDGKGGKGPHIGATATGMMPDGRKVQVDLKAAVIGPLAPASPSTRGKPRGSLNSAWVRSLLGWPNDYWSRLEEAVLEYHLSDQPRGQTRVS